jgi:molybdopterin molybdotransferase
MIRSLVDTARVRNVNGGDVRMCGFPRRTPVVEVLAMLERRTRALASEAVGVREAAGRVAAAELRAAIDVPHFARAMMDGYAVVAESTFGATDYQPRLLTVVGELRAGTAPPRDALAAGEALRITTGAAMPPGADAVVQAEHAESVAPGPDEPRERIRVTAPVSPGRHVGARGEDAGAGSLLFAPGRLLRPQDAGVLAAAGVAEVPVVGRPRVGLLMTGDEIVPPGRVPLGARVVDANGVVLAALVARDGGLPDEPRYLPDGAEPLGDALLATESDVVLVSGGSSVGPEDHAPRVLAALGELAVHGVAMRPSSPAGIGFLRGGDRERVVFLLPGNPVSCLCAYEFFAGPVIRALGGRPRAWPHPRRVVPAAAKLVSALGRTDYMRVRIDERGAHPLMTGGASILTSTTRADGVVIVPDDREGYAEGELVEVLLY